MKRTVIVSLLLLVLLAVLASGAAAYTHAERHGEGILARAAGTQPGALTESIPNPEADGAQATVDLQAGFLLDPYLLRVLGGGSTDASSVNSACVGYIPKDPDVVLNWTGETSLLELFVYSDVDPVLVVQTPSGDILCSDDASQAVLDPVIVLEEPVAGRYDIYVGSYEEDEPVLGVLIITEQGILGDDLAEVDLAPLLDRREYPEPETLPPIDPSAMQLHEEAVFGYADLESAPRTVTDTVAAGGNLPIFGLQADSGTCAGFVSVVPSFSFDWPRAGGSLRVFFEAQQDTGLAVVTPDGGILCSDNATEGNLNPLLVIENMDVGTYRIFAASREPRGVTVGTLTITTNADLEPETLAPPSE